MCNIAGYAGNRQAAPILLEMLRRQQPYDGGMSTGVATVYQGRLHYRKIVGDVDILIRETDVLDLPGTIGIAHTRPSGDPAAPAAHPTVSEDGTMAMVTNGTSPRTKYWADWDRAADFLEENGYVYPVEKENPNNKSPKLGRNGHHVPMNYTRLGLIRHYLSKGKTMPEALALSTAWIYGENITVLMDQNHPDSIFALRTTRPMTAVTDHGETYMATTRFGLPEGLGERAVDLPLFHPCQITRQGVTVHTQRMDAEPVEEMTPYTYYEGYKRFEALLKSDRAPLYFDELEFAVRDDMKDLWPNDRTFTQHARLVYDMLWQFDREGRLKKEMRTQQRQHGTRERWYMWLE